jgi:hypothetical protein
MAFNLPPGRVASLAATLLALTLMAGTDGTPVQQGCPPAAGRLVSEGWAAYRQDSLTAALSRFARSDSLCPDNFDAKVGLGYVALRQGRLKMADSLFRLVVAVHPEEGDAWDGLALAAWRLGDRTAAIAAGRTAIRIHPDNRTTRDMLDRLLPGWDRSEPRFTRLAQLRVDARTEGRQFEVPSRDGWRPFYLQGVNLGVALPGRFPAEFPPDSLTYAGWLDTIAAMGANTVRVYTILPPTFYRALRAWNRGNPAHALWLMHGVWTELPPGHDFDNAGWKDEFRAEMRRVVDLVHGAIGIPPRPGHAGGIYDADVSPWTLGYIIGREWEPFAVEDFDQQHPGTAPYQGRFLASAAAPAMDRWMAEQCDYLLDYEVRHYNTIRPIAYTNWPTLDPLTHPTETTVEEELTIRARLGRPASLRPREYDNDVVGLDAMLIRPTDQNPAGWFASYHAYPYYPDFMLYEPAYDSARSSEGRSNYFGYLRAMVKHHADIPLVIAEYGVPSSRGDAHWQPQGWDHGGHDETAQARIDARLTREIRESGAAGSILFAWIDEWFKKNWMVIDYEIPLDRTRLWHNLMDAEQNYGILGMYAGDQATSPRLGGEPARWRTLTELSRTPDPKPGGPAVIRVGADESYLYVAVEFAALADPNPPPWKAGPILLALDTYRADRGQRMLPGGLIRGDVGFEYLASFRDSTDADLRITPDYNQYAGAAFIIEGDNFGRFSRRPFSPVARSDGRFDSLFILTNRTRYARDGTMFPARGYNPGRLRFGTEAATTLADWYYDHGARLLELRLPWGLINVSDPSSATVLYDPTGEGDIGTAKTDGVRIGVTQVDPDSGEPRATLPPLRGDGKWHARDFPTWRWDTWEGPRYHQRLKPVYDSMRAVWGVGSRQ